MSNERNSKIIKFFSGKNFYIILAVCLIAVGVAGWSVFDTLSNIDDNENNQSYIENTPSYNEPSVPEKLPEENIIPDSPAQNEVNDVPYSEPEETTPVKPVAESFIAPIKGSVLKRYDDVSLQYSATYGDMRIHLGLDIKAAADTDVVSCGSGTVIKVYDDILLGRIIEIDHGNGITVKYCGLADNVTVSVGDTVKQNEKLATLSGVPSECADEMHLHIEVVKDGKSADPVKILKLQ